MSDTARASRRRIGLVAVLGSMAVAHVVAPEPFEKMVPHWVPAEPTKVNQAAAVAEAGIAALLTNRRTARVGAWAAVAWFVGILPVHVQEAVDGVYAGEDVDPKLVWLRLPLQAPLILWAWRIAKDATPSR